MSKILVTGGAGFIGSALIRHLISETQHSVVNLDKITYAGNLDSLGSVSGSPRYYLEKIDICDATEVLRVFDHHKPDGVMHLAAESHVDRSIDGPSAFIQTNIVGTYTLLEAARNYWNGLPASSADTFRFHHVSTDEVYGSLGASGSFSERSPYRPNSPYAASKASSDHLVRAWHHTYGLPVLLTNCSNNYGPFHFPEKLIPLMILNALEGKTLPVYGDGAQIRDWLYVDDHARALRMVFEQGRPGEEYNVGGNCERRNLDVVHSICDILEELRPVANRRYADLIRSVPDRPGHDKRYAIDTTKISQQIGWYPMRTFETGLRETVIWYLAHETWWKPIRDGYYSGGRLGLETGPDKRLW